MGNKIVMQRLIETRRHCHGVNEKLVVTLLPDGTLKVREHGRHVAVLLDVTTLDVRPGRTGQSQTTTPPAATAVLGAGDDPANGR